MKIDCRTRCAVNNRYSPLYIGFVQCPNSFLFRQRFLALLNYLHRKPLDLYAAFINKTLTTNAPNIFFIPNLEGFHLTKVEKSNPVGSWKTLNSKTGAMASRWSKISAWIFS